MTQFNVGDRVTSTYLPPLAREKAIATIVLAAGATFLIEFSLNVGGHDGGQGDGVESRWWVDPEDLTLVPAKPTKTFAPSSQCGKLLMHLASGRSITPLQAFGTLGVYRLAARIHELKSAGHKIISTMKADEMGKTYASYSLKSRRFV
jgi:hypothetical protein